MADIGNPIATRPRLVRLRTAPMPDPGEWCYGPESRCLCFDTEYDSCPNGYDAVLRFPDRYLRRPQSCIDSAEDVE